MAQKRTASPSPPSSHHHHHHHFNNDLTTSSSSLPTIKSDNAPEMTTSTTDRQNDFICPICFDIIEEASMTRCGHTFCYQCILKSVNRFNRCPKCNKSLKNDEIFPNYLLHDLIKRHKIRLRLKGCQSPESTANSSFDGLKTVLTSESHKLSLVDINEMLNILNEKKLLLESESTLVQNCLLHEFLKQLLKQKEEQQAKLSEEISQIRNDLEMVKISIQEPVPQTPTTSKKNANYSACRRRMYAHFEDFSSLYNSIKRGDETSAGDFNMGLDEFKDNLLKFSRYSGFRPLASLKYSFDVTNSSNIVSTIEFNKDMEYFAIGGVTKRIKVYDYNNVVNDYVDVHYPNVEMISSSKISCISWNYYMRNILASSDYEGAVHIWDINAGQSTKSFHEHEKRCWSVDFNEIDTGLLVSGSDDGKVKLWSMSDPNSIATLETKANVCCVKFNPKSSCHFAYGSAYHEVFYYDLRNLSKPLCTMKGHKKAVSYVKFLNANEIVSASTDSNLKLWNINKPSQCLRSFTGHINDKHFIGLATDRDYIVCGSEDNAVYVYYKGLSKFLFHYNLDEQLEKCSDFISAVCWKRNSNIVVAANSKGVIKVMEIN